MSELLPCPFCAQNARPLPTEIGIVYFCTHCGAGGPPGIDETAAALAWNTRPYRHAVESALASVNQAGGGPILIAAFFGPANENGRAS